METRTVEEQMKEKGLIEELNFYLNNIFSDKNSLETWKNNLINLLSPFYGEDNNVVKQFVNLKYQIYTTQRQSFWDNSDGIANFESRTPFVKRDNIEDCKEQAQGYISGIIRNIKLLGLPQKHKSMKADTNNIINNNFSPTVHQSNNQSVVLNLNYIYNILKDELTEEQFKEVQNIVESKTNLEFKKEKLLSKLKTFGNGILSNIIANILTNPQTYS